MVSKLFSNKSRQRAAGDSHNSDNGNDQALGNDGIFSPKSISAKRLSDRGFNIREWWLNVDYAEVLDVNSGLKSLNAG